MGNVMLDYSSHTLRLNRQFDNRTRRAMDRFKEAVDDIVANVAAPNSLVDHAYFDLDGVVSEDIADPTQAGQVLIRICNSFTSGEYDLNFTTELAESEISTAPYYYTTTAGAMLHCISGYHLGAWRWMVITNWGWSPGS